MTEKQPADTPVVSTAVRRAQAWKGSSARVERASADQSGANKPRSNVHTFTPARRLAGKKAAPVSLAQQEPQEDQPEPDLRPAALFRLIFMLLLVAGGLVLVHALTGMSQLQDCVMSGRTNCAPINPPAPTN